MGTNFQIKGTLAYPPVRVEPLLNHIAKNIVVKLLKAGIDKNVDIHGKAHPDLEDSTVNGKARKRTTGGSASSYAKGKSPDHPLVDEGVLYESFITDKSGDVITIGIGEERNDIAKMLQIDGVGRKKKKFKFFGVTDGMEKDSMSYVTKMIKKWMKEVRIKK